MTCGIPGCPHPPRGAFLDPLGLPDRDPLCVAHGRLSSLRASACMVRGDSTTGRERLAAADLDWRRAKGGGLVVPPRALPAFR